MGTPRLQSLALSLALLLGIPALASHDWFGQDLCRTYPERMPPGIAPASLPAPWSPDARLVADLCAQCHPLPGPGHHTAAEWPAIVARMGLLAEVASRFGGRNELRVPTEPERQILISYLQQHALRPLPAGSAAPEPFLRACGDCHAAPDPSLHSAADWPAVVVRMAGLRPLMARAPLDPWTTTQTLAFLSDHAGPGAPVVPSQSAGRWAALTPVALIALFALLLLGRALRRLRTPAAPPASQLPTGHSP